MCLGGQRRPRLEAGGWPQSLRPLLTPCSDFLSSLRLRKGRCVVHSLAPWSQYQYTSNSSSIHVNHLSSWEANQRSQALLGGCRGAVRPIAILEDRGGSGHIHVQVEKFEGSHSRGALAGIPRAGWG